MILLDGQSEWTSAAPQFIPDHWALVTKMAENMTSISDNGTEEDIAGAFSQNIKSLRAKLLHGWLAD